MVFFSIQGKSMAAINTKEDILKNVGNQIVDGSH